MGFQIGSVLISSDSRKGYHYNHRWFSMSIEVFRDWKESVGSKHDPFILPYPKKIETQSAII